MLSDQRNAAWLKTLVTAAPWNELQPPALSTIIGFRADSELKCRETVVLDIFENCEHFFDIPWFRKDMSRRDGLHNYYTGHGRDCAASCIVILCRLNFFGIGSLPARLLTAWGRFFSWCQSAKVHPSLAGFSAPPLKQDECKLLFWFSKLDEKVGVQFWNPFGKAKRR